MSVISVENLSKHYIIDHKKGKGSNSLRDAITNTVKGWFGGSDAGEELTHEEFWALRDVSFSVEQGDRVGIVGHNGAGKSTLLKILSKIVEPTTGQVRIRGRVASLLEVGTGFHPELTGRENIYLNGSLLGMKREEIKASFDEIVAFAGVERFLDTPVKRYSSGMYVRLGFAISAHLNPEIMIVDEVLAVGDADFQKKSLGKMRDNSASGRTILFVSHNLTAVYSLPGECIFNVGSQSQPYEKGLIRGECVIPGYFLNDGTYTISVMIVKDTVTPLYNMEEGITFDVEDYREGVAWYGKWPGYVRPQFPFRVEALESLKV